MKTKLFLRLCACFVVVFIIESCGCAGDCPVGWQPHAFSPVFYGYRDYTPVAGDPNSPPGLCRVFFPSVDGSPQNAAPVEGCCKYPLIILIHGHCLGDEANHYKKWFLLPAQLARSGYIVLVPQVPSISNQPSPSHPAIAKMESFRTWVLNQWEMSELVHPNTGVIGHSFGAPIGASFSKSNSSIKAFASMSGQYESVNDYLTINQPILFMKGDPVADIAESFVGINWNATPQPKHKAEFSGGYHWDYMMASQAQCSNNYGRSDCAKATQLSSELVLMFFTRYLSRGTSANNQVPLSLIPPDFYLTPEQQFFAGGNYLKGFESPASGCNVTVSWSTVSGSGSVNAP